MNFVVPLLAFVVATVLTLAFWDDFFHRLPYPLYIAAIAVSAWHSGWVAGMAVAVAAIAVVNVSQRFDSSLVAASVLLLLISAVISYLAESYRRGLRVAQQSEERYRLVNRVTNDVIWDWDLKTGQLEWNDSLEQVHGHRLDEVNNTIAWWDEHIHPDDRTRVMEGIRAVIESGEGNAWQDEYRFRRSDGTYAQVLDRGYIHRDQKGRPERMIGSMLDLTERKQAEEAVRESEAHVRRVLDSLFAFVGLLRLDGTLIEVNRAPLEAADVFADEVLGKKFWDCYWWSYSPDVQAQLSHACERANCGEVVRYDVPVRMAGDSRMWIDFQIAPLRDSEGRITHLIPSAMDITARRLADEAVRQSEQRLRQMADAMPQIVWVTRPDGYHEYYNRQWYEYTGVPEGATDGDGWNGMFHPDDQDRAWATWQRSLTTGENYEIEYRLRHHSGEYRWFLGRALPVRDSAGQIVKWFGTCTDIHDQKLQSEELARAKEAAERASAAKSEFLATLSHELRTPLTPVLLTVSLMESDPALPEERREDVATIRRNVELESQLISDLLDLTRIEEGKLELDVQDVDLHLIVRSAIDICQREASAKLTVELGAENHTVKGDSTRLRQVFWNLIGNAVKFTPPEGTITVRSFDAQDGRIQVEVSDTGQGIDPAVLPKLFTAFEQGEARASRQMAGLGLGLAISRKLAEAHGGTIIARSEGRGRGSTFTVELPAVASVAIPPTAPPRGQAVPVQPLRVLLVEDHEPTLRVMKRLLRGLGHRVSGVTSVAAATSAAGQDSFDLMICDLGLPDGSGLDVMRQLWEQFEGRAIALTGYGMESDIAASRHAGFAEHLTKPVDLAALEAAVGRVAGARDALL